MLFTTADKGNVTVALDKMDYINKLEAQLTDYNTYKVVKKNSLSNLKTNTYKILKHWNINCYLTKKYNDIELTQTNTNLSRIYGFPKIRKKTSLSDLLYLLLAHQHISSQNIILIYLIIQ